MKYMRMVVALIPIFFPSQVQTPNAWASNQCLVRWIMG